MLTTEQQAYQWNQVVTRAGQDEEFRNRLLADPTTVIEEFGLELPTDVKLRIVENSDKVVHLVLPPLQADRELSDSELEGVTGGLVVNAIIAVLIGTLLPSVQKDGLTMDQAHQVAAGNPLPRPR